MTVDGETFYGAIAAAGDIYHDLDETNPSTWCGYMYHSLHDAGRATTTSYIDGSSTELLPLQVFVQDDSYIVDCIFCTNAQVACSTDLRFLCNNCSNSTVSGDYMTTVFPV